MALIFAFLDAEPFVPTSPAVHHLSHHFNQQGHHRFKRCSQFALAGSRLNAHEGLRRRKYRYFMQWRASFVTGNACAN